MPPHCDTMDGPVVEAARKALETGNVNFILPVVPKKAEEELKRAFDQTLRVRRESEESRELADRWFFETVVRLHREGEGAPYSGLKPARLDWGPVVPKADLAIKKQDPSEVIAFLTRAVEDQIRKRFEHAMELRNYDTNDVDAARKYTSAALSFELYSHHLLTAITRSEKHGTGEEGEPFKGHMD